MRFHVSLQTSIKSNKTLFAMGKNLIEIFLLRYINFLHTPEDVTGLNWKGFSRSLFGRDPSIILLDIAYAYEFMGYVPSCVLRIFFLHRVLIEISYGKGLV